MCAFLSARHSASQVELLGLECFVCWLQTLKFSHLGAIPLMEAYPGSLRTGSLEQVPHGDTMLTNGSQVNDDDDGKK